MTSEPAGPTSEESAAKGLSRRDQLTATRAAEQVPVARPVHSEAPAVATTTTRRTLLSLGALGLGAAALGSAWWGQRQFEAASPAADRLSGQTVAGASSGFLSETEVHTVAMTVDEAALKAMLTTYTSTDDKEWIEVGMVIDGSSYERVGVRLKGNSSLRQASTDSTAESLPWLVRLDKFVAGQSHDSMTEFVIRSNNSQTALNEAVALDLLAEAGLASQRAAHLSFTANGSEPVLRLAVENPADAWVARVFPDQAGVLYKAEAGGDYSYRGDAAADYTDVFDSESGSSENYAPLAAFLQFINESTDQVFADQLEAHLDTAAFATYLAFEDLVANTDDIDGPGNNSYLWWQQAADQMTVVAWDHNLAFGGMGGMGGGGGGGGRMGGGGLGQGGGGPAQGDDAQVGRPGGRSNILVTRFRAVSAHQQAVTAATTALQKALYDSGFGQQRLDARAALVASSGLVEQTTIDSEKATIAGYFAA